jgi:hypothetical protein
VVVAHREEWWLIGKSDGSLVVTPNCKSADPGLNSAISQAYIGLPVLRWPANLDDISLNAVLRRAAERINTEKGFWSTKNN